jgi:hypothetical protein
MYSQALAGLFKKRKGNELVQPIAVDEDYQRY